MANIVINYDTITKAMSATQDGAALESLKEISFMTMGEDKDGNCCYAMSAYMYEKDDENDIHHRYAMYAKKYKDENTIEGTRELLTQLVK
jgi:hypothetical protein